MLTRAHAAADYLDIWQAERKQEYWAVDALEAQLGYALDRQRLEGAALVLASPIKANPPNWQHGRVLYAVAREYLSHTTETVTFFDCGTAKGFSALCLQWALIDACVNGAVISVDVIDPCERVLRNTIAETAGEKTLAEILEPWPEARAIQFVRSTGRQWLTGHPRRVHLAYVDGKHTYEEVSWEATLLAQRQESGDVVIFDDLQIPGVEKAVAEMAEHVYEVSTLTVIPGKRAYAIARKQ
jgi:hypothetical protein